MTVLSPCLDAGAETQEVWALGQAGQLLAECVHLLDFLSCLHHNCRMNFQDAALSLCHPLFCATSATRSARPWNYLLHFEPSEKITRKGLWYSLGGLAGNVLWMVKLEKGIFLSVPTPGLVGVNLSKWKGQMGFTCFMPACFVPV